MKKFAMFLLVFFTISTWGQQSKIDSLKGEFSKTKDDKNKISILKNIIDAIPNENYKESEKPILQLIELSLKNKDNKSLSYAYNVLSTYYGYEGNFSKAIKFGKKSIRLSDEIKDVDKQINNRINLGKIYFANQKYDSTYFYAKQSLQISDENKNFKFKDEIYNAFGVYFYMKGDEENAIENYLKALKIAEKNSNINSKITTINGLVWIYWDRKDYDNALKYSKEGLKLTLKIADKFNEMLFYRNLGNVYSRLSKADSAIYYYRKQLDEMNFEDDNFQYDVFTNLSYQYLKMNDLENAEKYARYAINKSKDYFIITPLTSLLEVKTRERKINDAKRILKEIYKDTVKAPEYVMIELYPHFINHYKSVGDYKNASKYLTLLLKKKENSFEKMYNSKTEKLITQYQTEKKENENLQLKKEKAEQQLALAKENRNKWIFGISLLLSLFTLAVFGYFYRKNQKQKQFIESLQKELHHRVKNNLSIIDSFIEVSKEKIKDPEQLLSLQELQNRIESINAVHQQLYQSQDVTKLELKKYLDQIQKNVAQSFNKPNIEILSDIPEKSSMQADKSFPVGLIVNEFLTNSFKYAFHPDEKGSIKIQLNEEKDTYKLNLSDTGKGLPDDFDMEMTPTFGMRIIKLLTDQLKGRMFIRNEGGLHLSFEFPK